MTLSSVKTFLLVSLITALIWLLAEAESLRVDKVQVHVVFRTDPAESERLVRLEPGQDFNGNVTLRLEGSTARVDALAADLKKEVRLEPGTEGVPADPGRHTVQLQAALRALPRIRDSGVTIADADPPTAAIIVDNLEVREAKVRVDLPEGQLLESAPEVTPATVRLRLPESASRSLPADFQLPVRIDTSALAGIPEGRKTTLSLPVELQPPLRGIEGVRVSPALVSISLTLRSRTASMTLPTVPVHVRLAPTEIGLWDIQIPESSRQLTDVTVTGPSDLVAQVRSGSLKPVAFVALSFEDLEKAAAANQPLEREPVFSDFPLPLKFECKQKTVRLTVKRREGGPAAPKSPSL